MSEKKVIRVDEAIINTYRKQYGINSHVPNSDVVRYALLASLKDTDRLHLMEMLGMSEDRLPLIDRIVRELGELDTAEVRSELRQVNDRLDVISRGLGGEEGRVIDMLRLIAALSGFTANATFTREVNRMNIEANMSSERARDVIALIRKVGGVNE